jgi:UDP-2-acetamido-3-amino-2,3-dideoxy-glucuronate N-acetyltransferase
MASMIAESAKVGADTSLGHFCVIGEHVQIGNGCRIGHHVIIHDDTIIGDGSTIDDHAVLGKPPLRSRSMAVDPKGNLPALKLSDHVVVGTGAIIFRGSTVGENSLVADLASLRENVSIGGNTIIGRGVAVENAVKIGDSCKIEAGAFICAHTTIEDNCFVAPEVTLTNDNFLGRTEERKLYYSGTTIRRGGRIGANATILPGKTVEAEGVAAAGSVVTKNIESGRIVAGVPAKDIKAVPENQQLSSS